MPEIGATLREARMRARIDVSEIEAQTKIRAKYLRALENEEWDLLPGSTFVKSFLRTYAQALGLDAKALIEEYRYVYERPSEADRSEIGQQPIAASASRSRMRAPRPGPSRGYVLAVVGVCLVIVLLIYGLLSGGSSPSRRANSPTASGTQATRDTHRQSAAPVTVQSAASRRVSLSLEPSGEVYVCLLGDSGRKVIPGLILKPGALQGPYHAHRFLLTLGNNAVRMTVNGKAVAVPASSKPIGYSITSAERRTLAASQQPTCG
jgi:transcriptional regulator with XRE-family HTH domain